MITLVAVCLTTFLFEGQVDFVGDGGLGGQFSVPVEVGSPFQGSFTFAHVPDALAGPQVGFYDQQGTGAQFTVTVGGSSFVLPLAYIVITQPSHTTPFVLRAEGQGGESDILGYYGDLTNILASDALPVDASAFFGLIPTMNLFTHIFDTGGDFSFVGSFSSLTNGVDVVIPEPGSLLLVGSGLLLVLWRQSRAY